MPPKDEEIEVEPITEETEDCDVDLSTNGWDAHIANCQLIDSELGRVHRIVNEFTEDSTLRKSQQTMLSKLQNRVLELTKQN